MRSLLGSIVFFVVAPGTVVVLIPWLLTGWAADRGMPVPLTVVGWVLLAAGAAGRPAPAAPAPVPGVGGPLRGAGAAAVRPASPLSARGGRAPPFPAAPPRHL